MSIDFFTGKCCCGHSGVFHWLMQRITAVALIPLPWWTAVYIKHLLHSPHEQFTAWLAAPWNVFFLAVFTLAAAYHAVLGIQVILDDYVHWQRGKEISMAIIKPAFLIMGVATLAAVWFIG